MSLFMVLLVAISLSMDAFSLALIYGTLKFPKKVLFEMPVTVSIFHFFMPLLGFLFGGTLSNFFSFNTDIFVGFIFIFLSIQMFVSIFKNEKVEVPSSLIAIILFAFTVSIDSFSVGVGLGLSGTNNLFAFLIFSIVSGTFTFIGLKMGSILSLKFGKISNIIGSIMLFILGIFEIL